MGDRVRAERSASLRWYYTMRKPFCQGGPRYFFQKVAFFPRRLKNRRFHQKTGPRKSKISTFHIFNEISWRKSSFLTFTNPRPSCYNDNAMRLLPHCQHDVSLLCAEYQSYDTNAHKWPFASCSLYICRAPKGGYYFLGRFLRKRVEIGPGLCYNKLSITILCRASRRIYP